MQRPAVVQTAAAFLALGLLLLVATTGQAQNSTGDPTTVGADGADGADGNATHAEDDHDWRNDTTQRTAVGLVGVLLFTAAFLFVARR